MSESNFHFPPTRAAAQSRLAQFAARAGADYAASRNYDHGPGAPTGVSLLSPYVKVRALDEIAITREVLNTLTARDADKFLAEVFWRTYWKGWMELRPDVWTQYMHDIKRLQDDIQTQSGLRERWQDACAGTTGITPFDDWAQELVQTGYLHNHARMWFASIWIFTLELPWQLGADFFLRHLLDGDAAVNTLSWRWVAGIQTQGKTYLASAENIAKFTGGRYLCVKGLAQQATPLAYTPPPPPRDLPECTAQPVRGRYGLLMHGDDMDVGPMLEYAPDPITVAHLDATEGHSRWLISPHVGDFRRALAQDMSANADPVRHLTSAQALADWASEHELEHIVAPYAPVGPVRSMLDDYLKRDALPLTLIRRPLDSAAWPLATKGFFPFRKHIPDLIKRFT